MNYDEKTDAELDALVAERVMPPAYQSRSFKDWSPTIDANAMMEVVERLRAQGYWCRLLLYPNQESHAVFGGIGPNWHEGIDRSIYRAVCIAALRAMEE